MCTLNLSRFFWGLWRDEKYTFMCETYTMFPRQCCSPSFLGSSFEFIFILQGLWGLPKGKTINLHFTCFMFFGWRRRRRKKVSSSQRSHTHYIYIPLVIKRGSDVRWNEPRKPWSSYYMLRVNKLFRKICLARFVAVYFLSWSYFLLFFGGEIFRKKEVKLCGEK